MASELETLSAIEQHGDLNPIQRERLGKLRAAGSTGSPQGIIGGGSDPVPRASASFSTGTTGTGDITSLAREMIKLQQEANAPAVSSLQASIPETSARFATERTRLSGEKEPLKQRYKTIIDEITRREKVDVGAQERVTSREFGRRGIPLSSGLFDTTLQEAVSPLRQFYTGQTKEAGLGQEEGLRGIEDLIASLIGKETEATRGIQNAIAQIQAGGSGQGIQNALSLYQAQKQAEQQQAQFTLQQALAERELGLKERLANKPETKESYATLGEGSTLFNLLTGQPMYTAPKTYKPGDQFSNWE